MLCSAMTLQAGTGKQNLFSWEKREEKEARLSAVNGCGGHTLPSAAVSSCWNILRGVKPQAPGFLPRLPHGIPAREGMLGLGGGFALLQQTKSSLCSWGYFGGVVNTELG